MSLSKTLESLEEFIETQIESAAQARLQIKRLELLKQRALENPRAFIGNLGKELEEFRTDQEYGKREPDYIDWSLYKRADPAILHQMNIPPLHFHSEPHSTCSESSFRRQATPILEEYRSRINALGLEPCPVEQEDTPHIALPQRIKRRKRCLEELPSDDDISASPQRNPESKSDDNQTLHDEASASSTPPPQTDMNRLNRSAKPKAELFNVPWTAEEQRLLEKCLLEIPSTEKQRWIKISKAMGGVRTGRQVASRVQKYNLKLKKFGLEPPA
ncbi:uncharacterized protein EI90DRAFT_1102105 [Cantharellus anzutake]|uniref:uncharacterized protein n=1 Tax=Cantharellus anzutake TaxID=1750568 RepID=UPI0019082754|nr:uncharacterized protein EI90DRAFT_1102105 [Cantharellus anzutake]KAF8330839.1 hypothetical protein EI90DRAFT_1102105 [Cantharellus anzutake]